MTEPYNEQYEYFRRWVSKYMPCPLGHQYDTERMLADNVVPARVRRQLEANRCPTCIGVWLRVAYLSRVCNVDASRLSKGQYQEITHTFEEKYKEYRL